MIQIPQDLDDLLHATTMAHVATIGPKGEPQCTPVWFDWDGHYIRFSLTKDRQKFRNLQRDPSIALSILDPNNPYRSLEIRGNVIRFDIDPDLHFLHALTKKYLGQDTYPWHQPGDEHFIIIVHPEHLTRTRRNVSSLNL